MPRRWALLLALVLALSCVQARSLLLAERLAERLANGNVKAAAEAMALSLHVQGDAARAVPAALAAAFSSGSAGPAAAAASLAGGLPAPRCCRSTDHCATKHCCGAPRRSAAALLASHRRPAPPPPPAGLLSTDRHSGEMALEAAYSQASPCPPP